MLEETYKKLNTIIEIGKNIKDEKLVSKIEKMKNSLNTNEKLRLTIIGQHFNELPAILSGLIDKLNYVENLFKNIHGKDFKSYEIKNIYNETEQYKIYTEESGLMVTSKEEVNNYFEKSSLDNENKYLEIHTNSEILKLMDINIICSANDFEDYVWEYKLAESDYIIFVLKADSLLSRIEKNYIEKILTTKFDLDRCTLLINNFDRIVDNEKDEVIEYVNYYINNLQQPIKYYIYSAFDVLKSKKENIQIDKEYMEFVDFISKEIVAYNSKLRVQSINKLVDNSINELKEHLDNSKKNLNIDGENIQNAINKLEKKDEKIQKDIVNIERKIEMYINGFVKQKFVEKINTFNIELKKDIEKEIFKSNDINESKKNITSYIQYAWEEFLENQQKWLMKMIITEMTNIYKILENNLKDNISDVAKDTQHIN